MAFRVAVLIAISSFWALGGCVFHPAEVTGGDAAAGAPGASGGAGRGTVLGTNTDAAAYDFGTPQSLDAPTDRVVGGMALGDAACAVESQKAQQVPLDIYMLLDTSESMTETTMTGASKWDAVRMALEAFLRDPGSAGIGVGLQYFPLIADGVPPTCEATSACGASGPCDIDYTCTGVTKVTPCTQDSDCGRRNSCVRLGLCAISQGPCIPVGSTCAGGPTDFCQAIAGYCDARDRCDPASYASPAVEVAPLPGAQTALIGSLTQHMPDGLTPTSGALTGGIAHAQALAKASPGHEVVVLLATDGFPSECTPNDIPGVASIAASGLAGTPAISTFVIGVFTPDEAATAQTNLDAFAAAGGTKKAFVISVAQNVEQQFLSALSSIRGAALSCEFKVPTPKAGATLDYFAVNVQYTSSAGQSVTIGNVKNRAACSPTKGGWYYDADPNAGGTPQNITVCDATCTQLQANTGGRVDVLLGCKTEYVIP